MYVVQICGFHKSGKTTTVKELIKRLKIAGYSVASIKDIHFDGFEIDLPNSDTYIHKLAGADPVIASGETETDFLYYHKMDFLEIARKISADWLVVEGFKDFPLPKIVCARTEAEADELLDRRTFAISGIIGNTKKEYCGLPVFNALDVGQANQLWELAAAKIFPMLPYVDDNCCKLCGLTCSKMVEAIIQDEKSYDDCLINQTEIHLKIGDRKISMVPFVQKILKNNILAVVSELDGWEKDRRIEVVIDGY
ncbi:MAG: molybdopterin-guanine dinucleotide biosynthesis protein B [bacterium]|nr:MAG: molybdopterin-guanine dinucleotide biosynthesis protein B [bacterium]